MDINEQKQAPKALYFPIFAPKFNFSSMGKRIEELDLSGSYTYFDYLSWEVRERLELIRGKIRPMSPAPNVQHQRISGALFREISWFLKAKPCQVFSAPFDVRLAAPGLPDKQVDTVVQPDLSVICDPTKLDERGCIGSPDIVVEVLSPGNSNREMREKYRLYENNGVPEYWVVFPAEQVLQVYRLNAAGRYEAQPPYLPGDVLETPILPGFQLLVAEVFE